MCGIVGYTGHRDAVSVVLAGLHRLEYRGYDSAGLATLDRSRLEVRKAVGTVNRLQSLLAIDPPKGTVGLGHTRCATRGRPSDANAHPQIDCGAGLAIVHNGIIENDRELRNSLIADGHRFRSETDTEVIAHLIERDRRHGLDEAVRRAARALQGSYAIACIAVDAPQTLIAIRRGSCPLVIGIGNGEALVASDPSALTVETTDIMLLKQGEVAVLAPDGVALSAVDGVPVRRSVATVSWDSVLDTDDLDERLEAKPWA